MNPGQLRHHQKDCKTAALLPQQAEEVQRGLQDASESILPGRNIAWDGSCTAPNRHQQDGAAIHGGPLHPAVQEESQKHHVPPAAVWQTIPQPPVLHHPAQ